MKNKHVALVTGSSRGIGLGIACELAARGFAIALNAPSLDDELLKAVELLKGEGADVFAAPFDVCEIERHSEVLNAIEANLGPLTTLVNNAGVGVIHRGDPLAVTSESFDRCMSVNARAIFFLSQAFSKMLLSQERDHKNFYSLINITSSNAVAVAVPRSEYCASKAAASMITKTFAVRLGAENIHVYDVQPGLIDTEMTAPVIKQYEERAKAGLTVLPRIGTPGDMGKIVSALASGDLPYTTGQVISADAGLLISRY